jgi:hypothetical protein
MFCDVPFVINTLKTNHKPLGGCMNKLVLMTFAVLSVIILPARAEETLPEGVKFVNGKYLVYDFNTPVDSAGKIAPVAIFNLIQLPDGVKLKKEWLINRNDSIAIEERMPTKFFWQGLIPKFEEDKKVLIKKLFGANSENVKFEWQKTLGQEKNSIWLIVATSLLFIASLLFGLSLRFKNTILMLAGGCIAFMAATIVTFGVEDNAGVAMIITIGALIMLGMGTTLPTKPTTIILPIIFVFLLISVLTSVACISSATGSLLAGIIMTVTSGGIFSSAWKAGVAKKA